MEDNNEVVIIGAGICGLATALALHRKGIKSVVFEKSESLRNVTGAAIGIRQNGWRALDQLGVADILRRLAVPFKGGRLLMLDRGKQQDMPMNGETRCLRRKDLIDTLFDALPPATVKFGSELESIKIDPNTTKPVLRFINGSSIIAKIVIGCDGNNLVGRIPINDKLVYWFCAQPFVPKDARIWKDPEVIRRSCLDLLGAYPSEIKEMIEKADVESLSFSILRYRTPWDLLTGTFCKGTVIVAGDAMHIMGPFLGQG
nr:aromatic-ring hydroxylase-like protein [Tanacetum cinerariifolium]